MNKEQKVTAVQEIKEMIESSEAMYFTDFSGLTVEEVNELRKEFYKAGVKYKVVKNTLTVRALKESGNGCAMKLMVSYVCVFASHRISL